MAVLTKPIVKDPPSTASSSPAAPAAELPSWVNMRNVISLLIVILTGHLVWYHTAEENQHHQVGTSVVGTVTTSIASIFAPAPAPRASRRSRTVTIPADAPPDPELNPDASTLAANLLGEPEGKFITIVNEDNCSFVVNSAIKYTPPQSKWRRRHCGIAVTRRAKEIPHNEGDPMLECDYFTSSMYAFSLNKFVWQQPIVQEGGHDMIHHIFSDFGCYTYYTIDEPVLFGTGPGHIETAGVVIPSKKKLLDVGSTVFVQRWKQHEMDFSNHGMEPFQVRNHLNSKADDVLRVIRNSQNNWTIIAEEMPRHGVDVFRGNVVTVSSRYTHIKLIGQVFQEFMTYISRIFTAGLFELPNLIIVTQTLSESHDEALRSWLYPYLDVPVMTIPNGRNILVQHPHFVTVSGTEAVEPCHGLFISYFLLPRILRKLRGDKSFMYGDEAKRNSSTVSDMEWLQTMPKKVFQIKNNANSRHNRGWNFDPAARAKLESWGFTVVSDTIPFDHRVLLINGADVFVTSFGALVAMVSRLYGGPHLRPNRPLRLIVMVHTGYSNERGWNAIRHGRLGTQSDVEVLVSDVSTLTPLGAWTKYIFARDGGELVHSISEDLMRFEAKDCTLNATAATDFKSRFIVSTPHNNDRPFREMQEGWKKLPKYGFTCPLPPD